MEKSCTSYIYLESFDMQVNRTGNYNISKVCIINLKLILMEWVTRPLVFKSKYFLAKKQRAQVVNLGMILFQL